ncbi:MAG TPA: ABC transporter permease [Candidatus Omnitrophota bacterium]|nr:ABC transporter permease [Candidatus Omnitrophota bacterium]
MSLHLFISWRYLITKRREKFISLISVISVLGIAIGVMALIVVIAVMTGFDNDLRDKIVGNTAHITVTSYRGMDRAEYNRVAALVSGNPQVKAVAPFIQGQVLVKEGQRFIAINFRAVDPQKEKAVTRISKLISRGAFEALDDRSVVIGKELALYLGAEPGSEITAYSAAGDSYRLTVAAIFASGMYDYDLNLIFVSLKTGQKMMGLQDTISSLAVTIDSIYQADKVKGALIDALGYEYTLKTWMEVNENFFAALALEKLAMFIILTLIILVASFNIVSTLIVMVVEKTKDIGILKAIGVSAASLRRIFTYQGLLIGGMGTLLGTASGVTLCLLLKKYQFIKLPQSIYYVDRLPVALELWPDLVLIVAAALGITLIATIYPAMKAAQMKPVEALRYE